MTHVVGRHLQVKVPPVSPACLNTGDIGENKGTTIGGTSPCMACTASHSLVVECHSWQHLRRDCCWLLCLFLCGSRPTAKDCWGNFADANVTHRVAVCWQHFRRDCCWLCAYFYAAPARWLRTARENIADANVTHRVAVCWNAE